MIANIIFSLTFILLLTFSFPLNYFFGNLIGSVLLFLALLITNAFYLTAIEFLYYLKLDVKSIIKNNFKIVIKSLALFIPIEVLFIFLSFINAVSSSSFKTIYEFLFKYVLTIILFFTYNSNNKNLSESLVISSTYALTVTSINILYTLV